MKRQKFPQKNFANMSEPHYTGAYGGVYKGGNGGRGVRGEGYIAQ